MFARLFTWFIVSYSIFRSLFSSIGIYVVLFIFCSCSPSRQTPCFHIEDLLNDCCVTRIMRSHGVNLRTCQSQDVFIEHVPWSLSLQFLLILDM